jgi:flagellar basal body P-ring protein FlgI
MTRRFMIHKHPHVITATEIQVKGSTGIVDSVLRFNSLDELVGHFTGLGASVEDLKEILQNVNSTGMATLVFSEKPKT